jgi:elongation factor P
MRISANSIRAGNILEHEGKLWIVTKTPEHTKPGKGGAFVQVEMKDVRTGTKVNERFSSTVDVEKVRLDQKEYQFMFQDDSHMHFMDNETFEQISLDRSLLGEQIIYLTDGMVVNIEFYGEEALNVMLPEHVTLAVAETEPVVKGQTAAASYKPAIMENGARVMVPPFVSGGDKLVVRTSDGTYVERAK